MAYTKIVFQNSPSTATPLNAQNLNHMDDGIAENDRRLNELSTAGVVNTFNSRTGNVTSEKGDYDINQIVASDGQDGYIPVWRNSGTEQDPDWGFEMEEMGGSGHEILDADGTSMAQEDALQFADAFLTDDSVNGRTVVENIKEHTTASDYEQATEDGIHVIDDGDDALIGAVSDDYVEAIATTTTTVSALLDELYSKIDRTKLTENSYLTHDSNSFFRINIKNVNSAYIFTNTYIMEDSGHSQSMNTYIVRASGSEYIVGIANYDANVIGKGDYSSSPLPAGAKFTLYYGNKKATVDLQTTANRCLMSNGETVQSTIDGLINGGLKMFAGTDTISVAPQTDKTSALTIADILQASGFSTISHILCNFKGSGSGTPALLWYSTTDSKFHSYGVYSGGTYNNVVFSYVAFGV